MSSAGGTEAPAVLSIDVEDWFQVENLRSVLDRPSWDRQELRVEANVNRLLDLLARRNGGTRATWFVLGWIGERCPNVVRRIAEAGHEVASHGFDHDLLDNISPDAFHSDVDRSKLLLEEITGAPVRGYRAPSFSITEWAIPILRDVGFEYDSSLFPTIAHDRYGRLPTVSAQPVAEVLPGFFEVQVSSLRIGRAALPWGGGGYFRLVPYPLFRAGARTIVRSGRPYVFYIHPWEIDPDQPRVTGLSPLPKFRHYVGLKGCEARLGKLLGSSSG